MFRMSDDAVAFWSGFFSAGGYGSLILDISMQGLIIEMPIKIFMAVVIAFMGGIAGLLGKDFYNHKIRNRFFNNNKK
jgi:TM2 domain-containing membrane protein YozV